MDHPPPTSKAAPSLPQLQWQPRSNLSIFIHTLHLLNFDLLADWPHISESTFSTSKSALNLQARVKSTEWALHHLFRLYSSSETQARLSSHFPPTTSLQGKNLRAGLYKWLTELKTTGVLPREIVLRKTMLDECKGEKFEEVLARFAMVVLRKQLAKQGKNAHATGRRSPKIAEGVDVDKIVPLILAHRVALQRSLRKRQDLENKATGYAEHLAQIRGDVDISLQDIQLRSATATDAKKSLPPNELEHLREQINLAFAGDRRWATFIFEGNSSPANARSTQSLQKLPFEDDDTSIPEERGAGDVENEINEPMRQLQSIIIRHRDRLDRLTRLRDSLLLETQASTVAKLAGISIEEPTTSTSPTDKAVPSIPKLKFTRHQELSLKF